jgi:hypothetical protein
MEAKEQTGMSQLKFPPPLHRCAQLYAGLTCRKKGKLVTFSFKKAKIKKITYEKGRNDNYKNLLY